MSESASQIWDSPERPGCLSEQVLDQIVTGGLNDDAHARHLGSCQVCRERLKHARDASAFLTRLHSLVGDQLGPVSAPRIPGYRVLEVIRSGAQGTVYKAVQDSTSRLVAIKTQGEGAKLTDRMRARAEREAEITARLKHPNVVTIYESRVLDDGRVAVVMEFIDGVPLDAWSPPGRTAAQRQRSILNVMIDVCAGLHHAHLNGVIHRDVKPANILLTKEGRPVIVDFGVAKLGGIGETMVGELNGTPAYASPEQAVGRPEDIDAITDVYSVGVVLYQLLCGALPYPLEGSLFDMARAISEIQPVRPRAIRPGLSPDLEAIVLRALSKPKQFRYESAAALGRDVQRFLGGEPVEARRGSGWYLLRKAIFLNRRLLLACAVALFLAFGAAAAVSVTRAREARARERESLLQEQAHREQAQARAVRMLLRETIPSIPTFSPSGQSPLEMGLQRIRNLLTTNALADDPELDKAMRLLWGGIYTNAGTAEHASMAHFAVESLRLWLMDAHREDREQTPDYAAITHTLAEVLLCCRNLLEAERQARRALMLRERLFGAESVQAAETRALLAKIAVRAGRPDDAMLDADRAMRVFDQQHGETDEVLRASLRALRARLELARGIDAGPRIRDALLTQLRVLSPFDHELLSSVEDLAALATLNQESTLIKEIATCWEAEGDALPLAIRRDADLLRSANQSTAGCGPALGRLVLLQDRLLGSGHLASVGTLTLQSTALSLTHEYGRQAECWVRASEILSERFGANSFSVLTSIENAAVVSAYAGNAEQAVVFARRAMGIFNHVPEEVRDPVYAINQRRYLAWFLALAGRYDEAREEWGSVIEQVTALYGPEHYYVHVSNIGTALCLARLGHVREADELSERMLLVAESESALPFDWRANIIMIRGSVLHQLGRHAEARPLFERAWITGYNGYGSTYPWRRLLLRQLAETCSILGDASAAELWRSRLDFPWELKRW